MKNIGCELSPFNARVTVHLDYAVVLIRSMRRTSSPLIYSCTASFLLYCGLKQTTGKNHSTVCVYEVCIAFDI